MDTINYAEWRRSEHDRHAIRLDVGDGDVIEIPPYHLWPEPQKDETNESYTRRVIGDDAWERFTAAGGTYHQLDRIMRQSLGAASGE